ncbi:Serpentine Receptor, class H [Caenorhabditis elegans]|uniref:Serpentine Receptor, class H n=1 Tax=Caenorhabditis elegans TaxID=6239 RepID=O62384_CAEEL|nr:Serpentine Receptor, class H [Caenorhabditis elegans]CAB04854.1 Serpentine Receptor, class H [Caenorhabditis elegans]|eukprot:NP_506842.1 Serpentine Receptor, class H [Caenorhabditis elegans]
MISCESHYLASPGFLKLAFHIITAVATPIHAFGFYCIVCKTPVHMKSVKWLLFNLHCWCIFLDITISFLGIPYILLPAMAGYGLGPVESPGLFFYLGVTFITGVTTAVFVTFENRFHILFGQNSKWRHFRKYAIVFSYIIVPLYYLPIQFLIPEQVTGRELSWAMLSCIPELPDDGRELFVFATELIGPAITMIVSESVPSIQCGTFLTLNIYNLIFARPSGISKKTVQMQHRLVVALIIQTSFTLFLFVVPVNVLIAFVYFDYQNQFHSNLIFFALAIHGIASTLIMVFAHKPYRDFAFSPFERFFIDHTTVDVLPVFSTSRTH